MSAEPAGFLYPFLEAEERDVEGLLADLSASAAAKAAESRSLRDATLRRLDAELDVVAAASARCFAAGGRLLAFGNGGSSTDAAGLAARYLTAPPDQPGRTLPARSLADDRAVVTALANDVGYDIVFARQLAAFGRPQDLAFGFSTSGSSENLLRGFAAARCAGMLTVGFAGGDGGRMSASDDLDHCFVVQATSIHRIQEVQAAVAASLWARTHRLVFAPSAPRGATP